MTRTLALVAVFVLVAVSSSFAQWRSQPLPPIQPVQIPQLPSLSPAVLGAAQRGDDALLLQMYQAEAWRLQQLELARQQLLLQQQQAEALRALAVRPPEVVTPPTYVIDCAFGSCTARPQTPLITPR